MKITYQQKMTKRHLKGGPRMFGPYWYAFWRVGAKVKCKYIGAELPEGAIKAINRGEASVNRLPVDLPGQSTIDFDAINLAAVHGYAPISIMPHASREDARKIYYWRCKRSNVTHAGRVMYAADFTELCRDRGWRRPKAK